MLCYSVFFRGTRIECDIEVIRLKMDTIFGDGSKKVEMRWWMLVEGGLMTRLSFDLGP